MRNLFLSNSSETKFIEQLKSEINECKKFYFSVSFIKIAGLNLIKKELESALERGVEGYLITSTYQNFTDLPSLNLFLNWMNKYPKFHVHLDYQCFGENGFHSKGYLFETKDKLSLVIGSTNITNFALLKNVEWNVLLSDTSNIETFKKAREEFNILWNKTLELNSNLIEQYRQSLDYALVKWDMDYSFNDNDFPKPNSMQKRALKELARNRDMGINKSLVIASTGSGKTYLAAFDSRNYGAQRLLFIVHRETILNDAMRTFSNIFKASRSYGLYTGNKQELNADFIFATSSMLSKHLEEFNPEQFDYIVFDEVHHIVANCGEKIFKYFKPNFLLGLTATPERLDNKNVFEIFDNNVSFELRLKDALLNNLIVPFHYYGIRDEFANYSSDNKSIVASEISKAENVSFISSQIEKYKKKNEKLKAIAFCTSIQHAQTMSDELNKQGYNTIYLTGNNDTGQRIKAFSDLQNEDHPLEIICCVDILNEGVDIPRINMIIFLRPTDSQTIFLQQLGRGLRKSPNKDYCIVLDFIGNDYKRSTQIALALGSLTKSPFMEKYTLKTLIRTNFESLHIPNLSIFFDELSKKEILKFLDNLNFYSPNLLKQNYLNFKKYLNLETYPTHLDYLNNEIAPDLMKFIKSKSSGKMNHSYYSFLKNINEDSLPLLKDEEIKFLDDVSDYLPLVRVDEYLIIKQLIDSKLDLNSLVNYNSKVTLETLNNAKSLLLNKNILKKENNDIVLNIDLNNDKFKSFLLDTLNYGISRCEVEYGEFEGKFKLFSNYTTEQIMMVLLESYTTYQLGTKFNDKLKEAYLFVNLNKDKVILDYKDKFLDDKTFQWESTTDTTFNKKDGPKILNTKNVYLFIRKMKEDHSVTLPYTFVGTGKFENIRPSTTKGKPTLITNIKLDNRIPEDYFDDFNIEYKTEKKEN